MARKKNATENLTNAIIDGIREKKGEDIVLMGLKNIPNAVAEYFIICHGNNTPQVQAIAESVLETADKKTGEDPWHKEGIQNAEWILLDYVNVVVHIFREDTRKFYQLEKLWADAEIKEFSDS
jgi:ribosome-associated protein